VFCVAWALWYTSVVFFVALFPPPRSRSKIFIVLELVTGGELFDKIVREGRFDEKTARFYFRQLVRGVKYCHKAGVCHRDLKPENLLLDGDGNLKISDFGLSALYTGSTEDNSRATLLHTTCGTPNYVAPEVLNDKGYDGRAADVWSMGVILYVLLAGYLPFDEPIMSALFRKIQKADFEYPKWFSPQIRSLLDKVLVTNPKKRLTLEQIEADPWLGGTGGSSSLTGETKTPGVSHVPSAQDMAAAIREGVDESESKGDDGGVRKLTAFDIVSMFGGMNLNNLIIHATERHVHRPPQFISDKKPAEIIAKAKAALDALEYAPKVDSTGSSLTARRNTAHGEVTISVRLSSLSDAFHVVTISRGRGDLLEYSKVYDKLMDSCADLVYKRSSA